jgi:hypothetical protein
VGTHPEEPPRNPDQQLPGNADRDLPKRSGDAMNSPAGDAQQDSERSKRLPAEETYEHDPRDDRPPSEGLD